MTRVTGYLLQDHGRLAELLRVAAVEGPTSAAGAPAYIALRAGLLRHIGIEEKLLFASARRRLGRPLEQSRRLRVEHAAIAALLVPTPDAALLAELAALLEAHDGIEEGPDGVYALCEALLGDDASRALLEEARAYPEVPVARHFDGAGTFRTAHEALAAAERIRAFEKTGPRA